MLEIYISMASGTNHSSLDRKILQNDDKNDKTQNVYLSRPTWMHKTSISAGLRRYDSGLERIVPRIEKGNGVGCFDQMTISPILIG